MRPVLASFAAASLLLPGVAPAQEPLPTIGGPVEMKQSGQSGKATGERTLRVSATVRSLDLPSRIVVIENEYGGYETIKVGPAVTGLDGLAPGDRVMVELEQGLVLEFQPPGSEFVPPSETSRVEAVPAGQATMARVSGGMQATVTITKIDAKRRIVTFKDPGGNAYRVKAGPKVQLEKLKPGDKLLATYTETIALKLSKKAPK
jgi:hypothetical protein